MKEGKLELSLLQELLTYNGYKNCGIISKGEVGRDNAVININKAISLAQEFYNSKEECMLVVKSDPITFPTPEPGRYAIIVNSNDLGCSGALPFGFLATIIAPPSAEYETIKEVQKQIHESCLKLKISVLGGHTEISSAVKSIIISGHMFGFVPKDYCVPNNLHLGDKIVQIGYAGAEGTGIVISEAGELIDTILLPDEKQEGKRIGTEISVLQMALKINKLYKPNLIHDATEGGIFGALYELVAYKDLGLDLDNEPLVSPVTRKISNWLKINPYNLISSGALIVMLDKQKAKRLCINLKNKGVPCKVLGTVVDKPGVVTLNGKKLEKPVSDEIVVALKKLGDLKNDRI